MEFPYEGEVGRRKLPSIVVRIVAVLIAVSIVAAVLLPLSISWLSPGEVAVTFDPIFKSFGGPFIGPTMFLKAPWQGLIKDFYTIDYIDMTAAPDADYPSIIALTKDGVEIVVESTFTYSIEPSLFLELAKNYPRIDYEDQVLVPIMRQVVRDIVSDYTIEEVIGNREEIASKIESAYRSRIEDDPSLKAIKLHAVMLRGIRLPERIKESIEAKIAAYQQKIAAQYERERILTLANASAMEKIILAEGEAKSITLRADAIREALAIIYNTTGDPEVLRIYVLMEQLQKMEKPIIILGEGLTPLIQIPRSEKGEEE